MDEINGWFDEYMDLANEELEELKEKFENILGPIQFVKFDATYQFLKLKTVDGKSLLYTENY